MLGGLGFGAYSAANLFMDAFVQRQWQKGKAQWVSINWDGWALDEERQSRASGEEGSSRLAMTPEEGIACFERILSMAIGPQVVVSTGDLAARIDKWIKLESVREVGQKGALESSVLYARPNLPTSYVAPCNEIEEVLATIWQGLLGISSIGVRDNFFELGGHSLIAIQMVSRLNQAFQIVLPIISVFESPTIEGLAEHIRAINVDSCGDLTSSDKAICIRKGGPESPLFLAHEGTSNIFYARTLSQYLDPDIPVYGLPDQFADEPQLKTVEALAMRMFRMIRTSRPRGPYRIAGWSFGGLIAYEIAVQLIGAGEEVEFLGLLDTNHPSVKLKAEYDLAAFDDKKMLLRTIEPRDHGFLESHRAEEQRLAFTELRSKSAVMEFDSLLAEAQRMSLLPEHWMEFTATQVRRILSRYHVFGLATFRYSPQRIPIPIHLFVAEENRAAGPFLGWSECLPEGQICVIPTAGTHHSMMSQPHVKAVGQALSTAIRNVSKEVNKRQEFEAVG
jgi:thioesterase domain-containing protein